MDYPVFIKISKKYEATIVTLTACGIRRRRSTLTANPVVCGFLNCEVTAPAHSVAPPPLFYVFFLPLFSPEDVEAITTRNTNNLITQRFSIRQPLYKVFYINQLNKEILHQII